MNPNIFPSPTPASSKQASASNASKASLQASRNKSAAMKSGEKGNSFSDALAKTEANRNQTEKKIAHQTAQKKALKSSSEKNTGTSSDRNAADKTARSQESKKSSPQRKRRSESLKKVGTLIGKGADAAKKSPALKLLTGNFAGLEADTIPNIVSKSGFIREAISDNIPKFMQKPSSVSEMIGKLDLPDAVLQQAEGLGLDLNEKVSPSEFFKAIGIDPQRIVAELSRLKDGLPKDGLSKYMAQATAFNQPPGMKKNSLGLGVKPEIAGELNQKKKELPDLLGGIPAVNPSVPLINQPAANVIATEESFANSNRIDMDAKNQQFTSSNVGTAGDANFASNKNLGSQSSQNTGLSTGANTTKNTIQQQMFSMIQSGQPSSEGKNETVGFAGPNQFGSNTPIGQSPADAALQNSQSQLQSQRQTKQELATGAKGANSSNDLSGLSSGKSQLSSSSDLENAKFTTEDIMSKFESSMDKSLLKKSSHSANSFQAAELGSKNTLMSGAQNLSDQLKRNQLGLESSFSKISKASLVENQVSASDQIDSPTNILPSKNQLAMQANSLGQFGSLQNSTGSKTSFAEQNTLGKLSQFAVDGVVARMDGETGSDFSGEGNEQDHSDSGKGFEGDVEQGFQKLATAIGNQGKSVGSFDLEASSKDANKVSEELNGKILDKIDMMVKGKKSVAVINLDSPEMGQISLAIQVEDDKVKLRIISGSEKVRNMLGSEMTKLGEAMALQNLQLTDVESSSGKESFDSNDEQNQNHGKQLAEQFSGQFSQNSSHNFGKNMLGGKDSKIRSTLSDIQGKLSPFAPTVPKVMSNNLSAGKIQVMA